MDLVRRKTGLLGGSFDPVHIAHIALAKAAYQQLNLDEVQLLPAGDPWQRAPLIASPAHRLAMLRLAARHHAWLNVNTIEIERHGLTYTIDTLQQLPADVDYYWILGSDQLENFCTWHAWQDIVQRVRLAVAQRPGSSVRIPETLHQYLQSVGRSIIHLPFTPQAVSATEIRSRLAQGDNAEKFLDPDVAAYIRQHRLYAGHTDIKLTV